MSQGSYQIVFRGRLAPGADETEVKANLARLFKIDAAAVERLFAGGRKVLKQGLDREAADRYRAVLRQAGAMVSVVSTETRGAAVKEDRLPPPPPAPRQRAVFQVDDPTAPASPETAPETVQADREPAGAGPPGAAAEVEGVSLAPPGVQLTETAAVAAPAIDTSGLDLAAVGAIVDESVRPPPLEMDLGSLSVSEDFERLDENPTPAPPPIEIFNLDLADPDAIVDPSEPPPPLEFDLGDLSASDDYAALDDRKPAPAPEIDTSRLKLIN